MAKRKSLGCLLSYANAKGEEALGRRVQAERTHVERAAMTMVERREETWRPMNWKRASAFIRLYLLALVDQENAYRHPGEEKGAAKVLNEALVRRVIPFIYRNRVWTLDESLWPITLEEFEGLNEHLADKFPRIHAGHHWQIISYFYGEIERERDEWKRLEELEREAKEACRRVMTS